MSSKTSATRRLSWLASSSLIAASLATGAFTAVAIAPATALAANECVPVGVDPAANGAAPDSYTCTAATYANGITYSSAGNLTVTKTNTGVTTVTANGVNLTGNGADSITWDSAVGGVTGGAGTNGPVIDVTSGSGSINITTNAVTATQAGITHAIRAISTGGGDITIRRLTAGQINNNSTTAEAAILAVSNGGDIAISSTGTGFFVTGRARGIVAATEGAGSVDISINQRVLVSATEGVAAIDATAGAGGIRIELTASAIDGGAGAAIVAATPGDVLVRNSGGRIGGTSSFMSGGGGRVDFSDVTGNVTFINEGASDSSGVWYASGDSVFGSGSDTVDFLGIGKNFLGGRDNLAQASIDLGAGDDAINLAAFLNMGGHTQDAGMIDFGAGADTFNVSGLFASHGGTLANLEALNLSGTILMGAANTGGNSPQVVWDQTDGVADDVLRVHGVTFTGSGDARIFMDADIGAGSQEGCETVSVADCLDLRGGSTAGVTTLTINNLGPDALFAGYDPAGITLVDVGGGTSAQGHFVLASNTPGLISDPLYGDVIGRPGLFSIALRYDPETQRHKLVGLPHGEVMEYAMLSGAAQSIWHMTADTVTDRQADLRGRTDATGLWLRTSGEYTKRQAASSFAGVAQTYTVDNDYKLYAGTIIGGMDLVSGSSGGLDYVLGAQIGYVTSSFDLDAGQSSGRFTGATGGVYGSIWSPRAFLDATFNLNGLTLDHESPALGSKTNTYTTGFGARLEGGMRWRLGSGMFVEPLVSAAFARTSFEEISLVGGEVQPADATSRRAALGLRVGGDVDGEIANLSYFVTGRAWNEFDGETNGVIHNPGADLPFADELTGAFGEAEAGLSLSNDANTLSGFLTSGVKFKDGYNAVNLSLGIRMAW